MKEIILIGGSPCSGKSSVAEYLVNKEGYQHIRIDDYMGEHINESNSDEHPVMYKWKTTPWHELFSISVETQFNEEIEFYEEEWPLSKRDVLRNINESKVVIEGCGLLPSKVHELFSECAIIYMVSEESFQVEKYKQRDWAFELLRDAKDVNLAFDNWMQRDIKYAKYIKQEAERYGYPVITVDGSKTIEDNAKFILSMRNKTMEE
jgi:2-phosphoglycerate kinase